MELIEFFSTDRGMKLLGLVGGGIATLGLGIWVVIKFFASKQGVTAKNRSIASGRDAHVSIGERIDDEKD